MLDAEDHDCYARDGYLLKPALFSADEIGTFSAELPAMMAEDSPRRVLEKDGRTVRALHGLHTTHAVCDALARHPRLVASAQQLLGGPVYVHQFKINTKAAFAGDVWLWHQDYIFWCKQDGMREPHVVNAMVFVDEVTEFNGPLYVIPGSHHHGVIDVAPKAAGGGTDAWKASVAADLKYSIPRETLADLAAEGGLASPKGTAGSVLFTHGNLVHGSPPNMSPFDRTLVIVTYNRVDNALDPVPEPRPEFLVSRDFTPIEPVSDDALRPISLSGVRRR